MTDDRRAVVRRRLLLLGLLPLLLTLVFAAKVATMLALDDRGRSAFGDSRFESARDAFALNARVNLLEPWVSVFDEGTADYRLEDFAGAEVLLRRALLAAPEEMECVVRINLALTLEAQGDASLADLRSDRAEQLWLEAIGVLDEGGCRTASAAVASSAGTASAAARSVATRLAEKLADREFDQDAVANPSPDQADNPLDAASELERRNKEAQEQRRKNEEVRQDRPPPDPADPATPPPSEPTPPPPSDPETPSSDPATPPSYSW